MRYRGSLIAVVAMIVGVSPAFAEDDPRWLLSTSVNYSVGDYGTGKDTTLLYVPLTLGVTPLERLSLSLTVPFIRQTTQTVVVTGGGVAVKKKEQGKLATSERDNVTQTEEGLGDVLLKGAYVLLEEKSIVPEVAPYLKIKVPTADKDRGLGTGELDETVGVDMSKQLVERLFAYVTVAYTFIGSPPGEHLRNSFGWSVGAAYSVAPPFSIFAFLDGATAISPGQEDPLEIRVGAEYKLTKSLKLTGAATKGLSNGSADWGVSGGLTLRF